MEKRGYVYILTNPSFKDDWVKIGKSAVSVEQRVKQLDGTAVPLPFEIYATLQTKRYSEVERTVHQTIDSLTDLRIRRNREFFNISPQRALEILKMIASVLDDAEITEYHKTKETSCLTDKPATTQQPTHEIQYKTFWSEFIQDCKNNGGLFSKNTPRQDSWIGKGIGVPYGINLNAVIGHDFARMEVYLSSGDKDTNKKVYDFLYSRKDTIEKEYGALLKWHRNSDKKICKIYDEITCNCYDTNDWADAFKFMKESSEKMSVIFHNHIIDFKLSLKNQNKYNQHLDTHSK